MDVPVVVIRVSDNKINANDVSGITVRGDVSGIEVDEYFVKIHINSTLYQTIDVVIGGYDVCDMKIWADVDIRKVNININVINHFGITGYLYQRANNKLVRTNLYFMDKQKVPIYITNLGNDRFNIFGVFCSGILDCFVLAHATSKFEDGHAVGSMVFDFMESILYDSRPFEYSNGGVVYYFRVSVDIIGEYRINFVHSIRGVSFVKVSKHPTKYKEIKSWDECPEAFDGGVSIKSAKK
jgi:hypothetical protein